MGFYVERTDIITAICTYLRENVTEFNLVKPYHGELDRYSKKVQLKQEIFPAEVNLQTPFALVISKNRRRVEKTGASRKFIHDISIYIGDKNPHDFSSLDVPLIFTYMSKCANALDGVRLIKGASPLTIESDGEYLLTTDLFTVYDQKYFQYEIGI